MRTLSYSNSSCEALSSQHHSKFMANIANENVSQVSTKKKAGTDPSFAR